MNDIDAARLSVAQASRILVGEAILDSFGHVSCRHPTGETFLISRSLAPALVRPDDVCELDFDGDPVDRLDARQFLERFLHAEIYRVRPDVNAIVHSHAMTVLPFAAVPTAMVAPVSHMCGFLHRMPAPFDVADHAGPASDLLIHDGALGTAFAAHLGDAAASLMRGHGYTVVGSDISEAVFRAVYTARNCEVQLAALQLGTPVYLSAGEAQATNAAAMQERARAWTDWLRKHAPTEWN